MSSEHETESDNDLLRDAAARILADVDEAFIVEDVVLVVSSIDQDGRPRGSVVTTAPPVKAIGLLTWGAHRLSEG